VDKDLIKIRLADAGRTMMMLPPYGTRPRGYASGWPDILRDFADMIGSPKENEPPALRATTRQMNQLLEVDEWIISLSNYCRTKKTPWIARTVCAASLRWPSSDKPVYTWSKLARRMHVSPTTVKRWHDDGIDILCRILNEKTNTANIVHFLK